MQYHVERLCLLKRKGFQPLVIYDIGAHRGTWSVAMETIFEEAQFFLFEANEYNESFLQQLPFPYFIATLGNYEGQATFYANNSTGDSLFQEQTRFYDEGKCVVKQVPITTLNALVEMQKLPLPDLIKIDVQGAEKLIIEGSPSVICHAEAVIVETKILEYNKNAPLMYELQMLMHKLGYRVLDVLELHYLPSKELSEVDLLFVKDTSSLIKKGILW